MGTAGQIGSAFRGNGGETFYVYANIDWDDNSLWVSVSRITYTDYQQNVISSSSFKWKICLANDHYNVKAGTDLGTYGFYGDYNTEYVLMGCTNWQDEGGGNWGGTGSFTITDTGGGGSGGSDTSDIIFHRNNLQWSDFPENELSFPNYVDWKNFPGATPVSGTTTTITGDFIITGNANGGSPNTSITANNTEIISNRKFIGWNTKANGSGTWYYAGHSYDFPNSVTLYGQQTYDKTTGAINNTTNSLPRPNPPASTTKTYTLTFNLNEGIMDYTSKTVTETTSYSFKKWTANKEGTVNANYSYLVPTTVYAQWNKNISAPFTMPLPVKTGYVFKGWSTSNNTTLIPAGKTINITDNTTYIANWDFKRNIYIHDGTKWISATANIFDTKWIPSGN